MSFFGDDDDDYEDGDVGELESAIDDVLGALLGGDDDGDADADDNDDGDDDDGDDGDEDGDGDDLDDALEEIVDAIDNIDAAFGILSNEVGQIEIDTDKGKALIPEYDIVRRTAELSDMIYRGDEQEIKDKGFEIVKLNLTRTDGEHIQWAVTTHKDHLDVLFVVFRGTKEWKDVIVDLAFIPVDTPFGTRAHGGMYHSLVGTGEYEDVLEAIDEALKANNDIKQLRVTGHSLGGGYTQLFMLETLARSPKQLESIEDVKAITFGSPFVVSMKEEIEKAPQDEQDALKKLFATCEGGLVTNFVTQDDMIPRCLGCFSEIFASLGVDRDDLKENEIFNTSASYQPVGNFFVMFKDFDEKLRILEKKAVQAHAWMQTIPQVANPLKAHEIGTYIEHLG